MASLSSSIVEKMALKPIIFKYQGAPMKSRFQDGHGEIKDTTLRHIDWNSLLTISNKPKESLVKISVLIQLGLVNVVSHQTSI